MINRQQILDVAKIILGMASQYKGAPHREMRLDGLVFGVLNMRFGVVRQYKIHPHRKHSRRIDFRHGGTNPAVIELVVRTEQHRIEAYGGQNRSELYKLARQIRARSRCLLILDVAKDALTKEQLKRGYDDTPQERGRGVRKAVRIVYVHADDHYTFRWPGR